LEYIVVVEIAKKLCVHVKFCTFCSCWILATNKVCIASKIYTFGECKFVEQNVLSYAYLDV